MRGSRLVSSDHLGTVRMWDLSRIAKREKGKVALNEWGEPLGDGASAEEVAIDRMDLGCRCTREVKEAHQGRANCVSISGDGAIAVSGGKDGLIKVWDLERKDDGDCVVLLGHRGPVLCVAATPFRGGGSGGGWRVVSGGQDGWVNIWSVWRGERGRLEGGGIVGQHPGESGAVWSLYPYAGTILAGTAGGEVTILSLQTGKLIAILEVFDSEGVYALTARRGRVACGGEDGGLAVMRVRRGRSSVGSFIEERDEEERERGEAGEVGEEGDDDEAGARVPVDDDEE